MKNTYHFMFWSVKNIHFLTNITKRLQKSLETRSLIIANLPV